MLQAKLAILDKEEELLKERKSSQLREILGELTNKVGAYGSGGASPSGRVGKPYTQQNGVEKSRPPNDVDNFGIVPRLWSLIAQLNN